MRKNAHLPHVRFLATYSCLNRRILIIYCSSFLLNNSCCIIFHSTRAVFYKQVKVQTLFVLQTNACFSVFSPIFPDTN